METLVLELENKRKKLSDLKKLRAEKFHKNMENVGDKTTKASEKLLLPLIQNLFDNINMIDSITSTQDVSIDKQNISKNKRKIDKSSKNFDNVNLNSIIIKPKELLVYDKEAQTLNNETDNYDFNKNTRDGIHEFHHPNNVESTFNDENTFNIPHSTKVSDNICKPLELSDDLKKQILFSNSIKKFIEDSIRVVERCLHESFDVCVDYSVSTDNIDGQHQVGRQIQLSTTLFDQKFCSNRQVNFVTWSAQHNELLLAVYGKNNQQYNDNDGLAGIWNLKSCNQHPEYYLTCQSQLLSASFAPFHNNLIFGGTYSGRVVIWDLRSPKRVPIQRSHLSPLAHTHPIYCCRVIGSQNANNLVTISTDGRLCSWSLEMMTQPLETLDLQCRQARSIAVTSLDFISGNANFFVCGSEEGTAFSGIRHGSKPGVVEQFESHCSPITSVSTHPEDKNVDLSSYFLTSSIDWTVKLWSVKIKKPLLTFESSCDYVNDVKWSPTHPSVFCSATSVGKLHMWDINEDQEAPVSVYNCDQMIPINSIEWTNCGTKLAAGCDNGRINVFDVGEQLYQARSDASQKLGTRLREIQNNNTSPSGYNEISIDVKY